jgi:hypothetical protein
MGTCEIRNNSFFRCYKAPAYIVRKVLCRFLNLEAQLGGKLSMGGMLIPSAAAPVGRGVIN